MDFIINYDIKYRLGRSTQTISDCLIVFNYTAIPSITLL